MEYPENRKLFTIKEVSHACGISRATILRLEESGFIKPYRIDPDTGYRYYDMFNITAIGQYQRLQTIGLSRKEISDLYYERIDSAEFIKAQRKKLSILQNFIDEYELRHDHSKDSMFSYVTLPSMTYYCVKIEAKNAFEAELQAYLGHEKCISEGYRMNGSEPLIAIVDDPYIYADPTFSEFHYTAGYPVIADAAEDPKLRFFPETEAFSIIGFGEYSVMPLLWKRLTDEINNRKLEPAGSPRLIPLVAPYAGSHYKPQDFCYQCVVPIKKRTEL